MSDIVFVTWDGGGNVPPALAIAAELRDRGHHIRVFGHAAQAETFADFDFTAYSSGRPFRAADPYSLRALVGVFAGRDLGRDVIAGLESRPADLVVIDCLLFGVMDGMRRDCRRYVTLEHSLDAYLRRAAHGPFGVLLRIRGLRPMALIDASELTLVPTLAELDSGHGAVVHIGPVARGAPASPDRPTLLLSLSTFAFPGLIGTWQRLLDAVDGMPVRVLATTGPAVDPAQLRKPANVELHRWLPHEQILPRVSVVVGHGGHATTMLALAHDLPLLVLPVDAKSDQPFLGRRIQQAGAGRVLGRRPSAARIRIEIERLLTEDSYRGAAARLGARIRALDGRVGGADLLESILIRGSAS